MDSSDRGSLEVAQDRCNSLVDSAMSAGRLVQPYVSMTASSMVGPSQKKKVRIMPGKRLVDDAHQVRCKKRDEVVRSVPIFKI